MNGVARTWAWRAMGWAVLLAAGWPVNAVAEEQSLERMILEEAGRKGVPGSLALAVAKTGSDIEESEGQAMPIPRDVAEDLYQVTPTLLANSPRLNVQLGIDYLSRQLENHDGDWEDALGAYYDGDSDITTGEKNFIKTVLRTEKKLARQGIGVAQGLKGDGLLDGWTREDLADLDMDPPKSSKKSREWDEETDRNTDRTDESARNRDEWDQGRSWDEEARGSYDEPEPSQGWGESGGDRWVSRTPPWEWPEARQGGYEQGMSAGPARMPGVMPSEREMRRMVEFCRQRTHKPEAACRRDVLFLLQQGRPPA